MQTDRMVKARAVKRRLADMKMARELARRGWTCVPPVDEIQTLAEERVAA